MKKLSILILIIFLLTGCTDRDQQTTMTDSTPEQKIDKSVKEAVKLEEMKLIDSRNINEKVACSAEISYPKLLKGDKKIINEINKIISNTVTDTFLYYHKNESSIMKSTIDAETPDEALSKYMTVCLDEFRRRAEITYGTSLDQTDLSKYNVSFYQKLNYQVTLNQNDLLSLRFDLINEFGGAHPIYWTSVLTFNTETGKLLGFNDIFHPEKLDEFYRFEKRKLVENKTHDWQFVEIEKALEAGTQLPENFQLKAFYLTPEGVSSVYQDYEIAGHAPGPPSLTIPYNDLKDFIKEDGPLAVFLDD